MARTARLDHAQSRELRPVLIYKRGCSIADVPGCLSRKIDQTPHLDATVLEESAASSRLVASFLPSGNMCGVAQLGEGEIEYARMMPLLIVRPSASSSQKFLE